MGPLVPPRMCPCFPRMLIRCQRLAGHPTQMEDMPPDTPKPSGSSLRNELKPLQHSGDQKAPALRCFLVPWVWLVQKGSVLRYSEERALLRGRYWDCDNGYLKEGSLPGDLVVLHRSCWPYQPHWHTLPVLIPVPITLTRVARLSLQCRLIPHSSVISERSSSSNSSRLMSWVSLEGVEMARSSTVGREQHRSPWGRLSQS